MQFCQIEPLELRRLLAAVSWDGGGDGVNFTDPLNWSTDALPTAADDVTVNVPGTPALRLAGATILTHSLVLREPLRIETGGVLGTATTATSELSIELDGGGIRGGTWTFGFAGAVVAGSNPNSSIQVVTLLDGDVLMTTTGAKLRISGSLALDGTIRMGQGAGLTFVGFNTLASGTIRFESTAINGAGVGSSSGTLTLGSAASVTALTGALGAITLGVNRGTIHAESATINVSGANTLRNEGTINAVSGGSVRILAGDLFVNASGGTLNSANGGVLAIQGTDGGNANVNTRFWSNFGTIHVNGGTLYLGGTFRSDELGNLVRSGAPSVSTACSTTPAARSRSRPAWPRGSGTTAASSAAR